MKIKRKTNLSIEEKIGYLNTLYFVFSAVAVFIGVKLLVDLIKVVYNYYFNGFIDQTLYYTAVIIPFFIVLLVLSKIDERIGDLKKLVDD